jgi:hypothetical protein
MISYVNSRFVINKGYSLTVLVILIILIGIFMLISANEATTLIQPDLKPTAHNDFSLPIRQTHNDFSLPTKEASKQHQVHEEPNPTFDILKQAIEQNLNIEMSYVNANGTFSNRIVQPKHFKKVKHTFCFSGFCNKRQEDRTFALKRIKRINLVNRIEGLASTENKTPENLMLDNLFREFETIDKRSKKGCFWVVVGKDQRKIKKVRKINKEFNINGRLAKHGSRSTRKRSAFYFQ